jgi:hypothetical protein
MKELDTVVLVGDLPEHGLRDGDLGTVVMVHDGGAGFEVEFATLHGETVAVVSLSPDRVRAISPKEIGHAREVANA